MRQILDGRKRYVNNLHKELFYSDNDKDEMPVDKDIKWYITTRIENKGIGEKKDSQL